MKKLLIFLPLIAGIGFIIYKSTQTEPQPPFVDKAQTRVTSYLSNSYGPVSCEAAKITADKWAMACHTLTARVERNINYALYPPEKAPYGVADGFYLVALNAEAKKSAHEGLMRYLKIGTDEL
ncbi:hypothetical protein ACQYRI_15500 [Salmonella enterica]